MPSHGLPPFGPGDPFTTPPSFQSLTSPGNGGAEGRWPSQSFPQLSLSSSGKFQNLSPGNGKWRNAWPNIYNRPYCNTITLPFLNCHYTTLEIRYCIVPRWSVTFWTHPEIIPVGQFFRRWIKSINQSSVDFHFKPSIDWLINNKSTLAWLVYWIRTARSVFTGAGLKWPNTAGQHSATLKNNHFSVKCILVYCPFTAVRSVHTSVLTETLNQID